MEIVSRGLKYRLLSISSGGNGDLWFNGDTANIISFGYVLALEDTLNTKHLKGEKDRK